MKLRSKYLRISVQIYDNAICVLNVPSHLITDVTLQTSHDITSQTSHYKHHITLQTSHHITNITSHYKHHITLQISHHITNITSHYRYHITLQTSHHITDITSHYRYHIMLHAIFTCNSMIHNYYLFRNLEVNWLIYVCDILISIVCVF